MANYCDRVCESCSRPFQALVSNVRRGWGRYCSRACKVAAMHAVRPGGPTAKLTPDDVTAIRASHEPTRQLAKRYGVTPMAIRMVIKRQTWAHVE